jgi:hypothetical protein
MTEDLGFSEPSDLARETTLALTLRVVRRRRIVRRVAAVLVVAAAYAAGFATPRSVAAPAGARPPAAPLVAPQPPEAPGDAPADLESRAALAKSDDERAGLLRAAGDAYLAAASDVEAALRCYRQLLEIQSKDVATGSDAADSWLLAALKRGTD